NRRRTPDLRARFRNGYIRNRARSDSLESPSTAYEESPVIRCRGFFVRCQETVRRERRSVLRILPAAEVGRASTTTTSRIFLYGRTRSATNAFSSSASGSSPTTGTTKATGS